MEFQIKNHYVKKFLQKHTSQNEMKVLKYATIIGINYLENSNQSDLSFHDLKRKAKEISEKCPKETKKIDNELKIIKSELERLNKKFEEKINLSWTEPNLRDIRESSPEARKNTSETQIRGRNNNVRPPIRAADRNLENRKATSLEPKVHPEWWFSYQETKSRRNSLTPKPNEIELPKIAPTRNKSLKFKHHLDDSEARQAFKEEEVVAKRNTSLPKSPQISTKSIIQENLKNPVKELSNSNKKQVTSQNPNQREVPLPFNIPASPKFNEMQEIFENIQSVKEKIGGKENNMSSQNTRNNDREILQPKDVTVKTEPKKQFENSKKKNFNNFVKSSNKSPKNLSINKNTANISLPKKNQPTTSTSAVIHDMTQVRSKIRSDVEYDKELARQYKKMKEELKRHGGYVDETEIAEIPRVKDKFQLIYKEPENKKESLKIKERERENDTKISQTQSKLGESSSSNGNYSGYYNYKNRNQNSSMNKEVIETKKDEYNNTTYEEQSDYRPSTGINPAATGMLEIANSFLNSPLMHHLSNMDSKNSDASSKDSSNPNTVAKNYSGVRINNFETRSPSGRTRSPNQRYDDDESKSNEYGPHSHKYSDWVGVYRADPTTQKNDQSHMKDSSYKRYGDYGARDSRYTNKDEGSSSLTSSNFSNFLNDEMKGFYQKETFDLKRSKNSRSQNRINGPSEHSSNISFNANEGGPSNDDQNLHSRKSAYLDNNKSYIGNSYDGGNIFKQERMSVTRLLNNTNY